MTEQNRAYSATATAATIASGEMRRGAADTTSEWRLAEQTVERDLQRHHHQPAVLCGIGDLEKLVGKKRLAALCADFITKPQGKPTLATSDDKRPEYNSAADDFKDLNF